MFKWEGAASPIKSEKKKREMWGSKKASLGGAATKGEEGGGKISEQPMTLKNLLKLEAKGTRGGVEKNMGEWEKEIGVGSDGQRERRRGKTG